EPFERVMYGSPLGIEHARLEADVNSDFHRAWPSYGAGVCGRRGVPGAYGDCGTAGQGGRSSPGPRYPDRRTPGDLPVAPAPAHGIDLFTPTKPRPLPVRLFGLLGEDHNFQPLLRCKIARRHLLQVGRGDERDPFLAAGEPADPFRLALGALDQVHPARVG